jgi:hypothetical protein
MVEYRDSDGLRRIGKLHRPGSQRPIGILPNPGAITVSQSEGFSILAYRQF